MTRKSIAAVKSILSNTLYHVTTRSALADIREKGLIPQIGPRAKLMDETIPCVWLFTYQHAMEESIMNWLGDEFDENEDLMICEVTLDNTYVEKMFYNPHVDFEIGCMVTIPVDCIKFLDEGMEPIP